MFDNIKYLLMGAILTIALLLLTQKADSSYSSIGQYYTKELSND